MKWTIRKQNILLSLTACSLIALFAVPFSVHAIVIEENHPDAEKIMEENPSTSCVYFLDEYLHPLNSINHEWEVKKLQMFLNAFINTNLELNGVFDAQTEMAAMQFQLAYNDQILVPWAQAGYNIGPFDPTGYVYITTRHTINELLCVNDNVPLPALNPDDNVMNGEID